MLHCDGLTEKRAARNNLAGALRGLLVLVSAAGVIALLPRYVCPAPTT